MKHLNNILAIFGKEARDKQKLKAMEDTLLRYPFVIEQADILYKSRKREKAA